MTEKNKKEEKQADWKALVIGFVANMVERIEGNISERIQKWTIQMKRRAAGSVVMVLGVTFLLTGLSMYADAVWGKSVPGLGYIIIGAVAVLAGYFISKK